MKFNAALAVGVLMLAGCSSLQKKTEPAPAASPSTAVAAPAVDTKAVAKASGTEVTCENGADKRVLTVELKNPGCDLHYLKGGKSIVIATSMSKVEFCDEIQERVKKRLEDSQYTCK